jgi:ADP-ribosyl-[dinitrogen reductase] hydrolase
VIVQWGVWSVKVGNNTLLTLAGLAVGDWVGVPLEFLPVVGKPSSDSPQWVPETFTYTNLPKIKEAERGEMKMGQWSDDTSMALCLADSIILNSGYSGSDVRKRFWNWQAEGLNNCFRNDTTRDRRVSFGLGYNIANSLLSMEPGVEPMACFESDSEDSGNGSLMRLAPVPIFFSCSTEAELKDLLLTAALSSMATHPGALASESCQFLAFLIMKAIQGPPQESAKQFMDSVTAEYLSLIQVRKSDIFGKPYSEQVLKSMTELITSSPSSA